MAINPSLYPNAGYDPRKDFAPIGLIGSLPSVLVVHPSLPVHSAAELIAYAKANPGKINYAFVPGTVGHIATELFAKTAGIELTKIPYKGNGDALGNLIGGHVSMMVLVDRADHRQRQGGHVARARGDERRALGAAARRAADRGIRPAGLLRRDPLRSCRAARHAAADHRAAEQGTSRGARGRRPARKLAADGAVPEPGTPEDYAAAIDADEKKWAPIVKSLNLKIE